MERLPQEMNSNSTPQLPGAETAMEIVTKNHIRQTGAVEGYETADCTGLVVHLQLHLLQRLRSYLPSERK